ncbi:hypothetical protein ACWKSP_31845 [Micromonosporaceae bacterium Da 78-11]
MFLQQSQVAANGFSGNCQFRSEFRDVDLALASSHGDDLMLPLVRIHPAPPSAITVDICNTGETCGPHHGSGEFVVYLPTWSAVG